MFKPITKWNRRIENPHEISNAIVQAFGVITTGRPSPIHLEVPVDILKAELSTPLLVKLTLMQHFPRAQRLSFLASDILVKSKYPLIIAGDGVVSAETGSELIQIAKILNALIWLTSISKRVLQTNHPLYAGVTWNPFTSDTKH